MLNLKTLKGSIYISGDTYAIKDQITAMPATRWHKSSKSYVTPATVGAIRNLRDLLQATGQKYTADAGVNAMRTFLRLQDQAQVVKSHRCGKTCPAWHHQGEAIKFIKDQTCPILNMPTGTGKTKTVIDLIALRQHQVVLVITKKKAVGVWRKDVAKFQGDAIKVTQLDTGSVPKNMKLAADTIAQYKVDGVPVILVTNYQSVWRNPFKKWVLKQDIDLLVLDESHCIKAPGGSASTFMKSLRKVIPAIVSLSATFFGDKPIDIYGQMRSIDSAVFGTRFADFKDRYCIMGGFNDREILGYRNQDEMIEKLAPYIFQVDKEVLNLLPTRHKTYYCKLPASLMQTYHRFDKSGFVSFADQTRLSADNVLVKLLRCQQLACGLLQADESDEVVRLDTTKLDTLEEILTDLPDMEDVPPHTPVVVYCRFKEDLLGIKEVATKLGYVYGEISGNIDQQEDFKAGRCNLLGCQIQAGGTGVDGLQDVCSIGIYYSTDHSLVAYLQSQGRLDRPGQTRSVLNIYIVAEDTVDEDIRYCHENKEDIINFLNKKLEKIAADTK